MTDNLPLPAASDVERTLAIFGKHDRAWQRRKASGWAILTQANVKLIIDCKIESIVEVCAGSGANAALLRKAGVQVVATDLKPTTIDGTTYQREWNTLPSSKDVIQQDAVEAVRQYCSSAKGDEKETTTTKPALLMCYPDRQSDLAERVLAAYTGDTVLYVGEGRGGCSATDTFFDALDQSFDLIAYGPTQVVNEDTRDCLWILVRHQRASTDPVPEECNTKTLFGRCIPQVVPATDVVLDVHAQMSKADADAQGFEAKLIHLSRNLGDAGCVIS